MGCKRFSTGRLANSTIKGFISQLIISEEVGAAKPQSAFFDAALERCGYPAKGDMLIIGDSLTSDMQGGLEYGIDTCWYNPSGVAKPDGFDIVYEIKSLHELLEIVD